MQCFGEYISRVKFGIDGGGIDSIIVEHANISLTNTVVLSAVVIDGFLALLAYAIIITKSRCEIIHRVVELFKERAAPYSVLCHRDVRVSFPLASRSTDLSFKRTTTRYDSHTTPSSPSDKKYPVVVAAVFKSPAKSESLKAVSSQLAFPALKMVPWLVVPRKYRSGRSRR